MLKVKRLFSFLLILLMLLSLQPFYSSPRASAAGEAPTRVINVVYDDSGSMYAGGNMAWSQAKYSAEVFASMLGGNDTMNIYLMSKKADPPFLTLYGSSGPQANVDKVHNMVTERPSGTPFETIVKAYNDLVPVSADEKWLIILTDGDRFDTPWGDMSLVNDFFDGKAADILTYFIAFIPERPPIRSDAQNFFFEHAPTGLALLDIVTNMCSRVFNYNKLSVAKNATSIEFDIPMSELTFFVQGQNVGIGAITDPNGNQASGAPVHVKYSTEPTPYPDYANSPYDSTLNGYLAKYVGDFPAGKYDISVTDAETIEVYYKPNIEIKAYLKDANGNDVPSNDVIKSGDYTVTYGFVKKGTNVRVPESRLLGEVRYDARAFTNNNDHGRMYGQNDTINAQKDRLRIDVTATYLVYHTVSTRLEFTVIDDKVIAFTETDSPEYTLSADSLLNSENPIVIRATIDGREFTADEWDAMGLPQCTADADSKAGALRIEKGARAGEFHIFPSLYNNDPVQTDHGNIPISLTYAGEHSGDKWLGSGSATLRISLPPPKPLTFTEISGPTYVITPQGFRNGDEPIRVKATIDGRDLTAQEWSNMAELPAVTLQSKAKLGPVIIEKTAEPGIYNLYPTLFGDDPGKTSYTGEPYNISYEQMHGRELWSGAGDGVIKIEDGYSFLQRNLKWIITGLSLLLLALIILWWMTRKAFPKDVVLQDGSDAFRVKPNRKPIASHDTDVTFERKARTLTITSPRYARTPGAHFSVTFAVAPIDKRYVLPPSKRRICVTGINSAAGVKQIEIAGVTFVKDASSGGAWVNEAFIDSPSKKDFKYSSRNATVGVESNVSSLELTLEHR